MKEIGVSNFSLAQIDEMTEGGQLPRPWCNQIELHPYLPQHALVAGLQVRTGVAHTFWRLMHCFHDATCM